MPEKILLIRLRELGDSLLMTPLVRQLSRLHPRAEIDVVCQASNRCVFEHNPGISQTITQPRKASPSQFLSVANTLRCRRYDLVLDVQGLPKTALLARLTCGRERVGFRNRGWRNRVCYTRVHGEVRPEYAAQRNLRLLADERVDFDDIDLEFPVHQDAEKAADVFCRRYFHGPVAAIFGISRFGSRLWRTDRIAAIADRLAARGLQPWLVYGPGQAADAEGIALQMRQKALVNYEMPSFPELRAILGRCELFFGNDGGPKHAAVSAGIPTVTVYSSGPAIHWAPPNRDRHRVVCTRLNHAHRPWAGRATDAASIDQISIDDVWSEITDVLKQSALTPQGSALGIRRAA
jgi:ADP-heptose:LPS heptosyltransferase